MLSKKALPWSFAFPFALAAPLVCAGALDTVSITMVASKRLDNPRALVGATASAPPKTLGNKGCMVSARTEREVILLRSISRYLVHKAYGVGLSAVEFGRRNNFRDRYIRVCGDARAPIGSRLLVYSSVLHHELSLIHI